MTDTTTVTEARTVHPNVERVTALLGWDFGYYTDDEILASVDDDALPTLIAAAMDDGLTEEAAKEALAEAVTSLWSSRYKEAASDLGDRLEATFPNACIYSYADHSQFAQIHPRVHMTDDATDIDLERAEAELFYLIGDAENQIDWGVSPDDL